MLQVFKTLFNIAHCFGSLLGSSWIVLLDTFEQFDAIVQKRSVGATAHVLPSTGALIGFPSKSSSIGDGSGLSARRTKTEPGSSPSRRGVRGKVMNMFKRDKKRQGGAGGTPGAATSGPMFPFPPPTGSGGGGGSGGSGSGSGSGGGGGRSMGISSALGGGDFIGEFSGGFDSPKPTASRTQAGLTDDVPDDEITILTSALSNLFESTLYLPDASLMHLVGALSDLTLMALAQKGHSLVLGAASGGLISRRACRRFMERTTRNMARATMMKLITALANSPRFRVTAPTRLASARAA